MRSQAHSPDQRRAAPRGHRRSNPKDSGSRTGPWSWYTGEWSGCPQPSQAFASLRNCGWTGGTLVVGEPAAGATLCSLEGEAMSSKRRFGALRKLPSGRWQARYLTPDGREITAPKTFATKTDASLFLDATEVDQMRGVWHDPSPGRTETLRSWSARWLAQHRVVLTVGTAASYENLLKCCVLDRVLDGRQIGLGDLRLTSLTPMRVGEWLADLQRCGLSARRVRKAYRILSLAMDAAVRDKLLATSPCGKHHRLPRLPEHEPTILTVEQVEKLIGHLRDGSPRQGRTSAAVSPSSRTRSWRSSSSCSRTAAYGSARHWRCVASTSTSSGASWWSPRA